MSDGPDNFDASDAAGGTNGGTNGGANGGALDAYHDGLLSPEARDAFERRLISEPVLRDELDRQRAIDTSLRHSLAPTDAALERVAGSLVQRIEMDARSKLQRNGDSTGAGLQPVTAPEMKPTVRPPAMNWSVRRTLAIAAALLLCVSLAALLVVDRWDRASHGPYRPPSIVDNTPDPNALRARPFDELYRKQVANGMKPAWVCKDQEEFGSYFKSRLGETLWMHTPAVGTSMIGLTFAGGVSDRTIAMLGESNAQPVVVLADRSATAPPDPLMTEARGLHIYTRQLGAVMLYEVSPLDHAVFLETFYIPSN